MRSRFSLKTILVGLLLTVALMLTGGTWASSQNAVSARRTDAYDLSEWQGRINGRQAARLKHEVSFVILRAQSGSSRQDLQYNHNISEMNRHQIPYGAYSYSLYRNSQQARNEASALYNRAPGAKFYVNDIEANSAGRRIGAATTAWAKQMKRLTTRPVVLYSYSSFIQQHLMHARKAYNAIWLAGYSSRRPVTSYKYDLWQFTDSHYSKALGKKLDASRITGKPLTFWIGQNGQPESTTAPQTTSSTAQDSGTLFSTPRFNVRHYHHEMKKARRNLVHGRRLSHAERKALREYQRRHGFAFQY